MCEPTTIAIAAMSMAAVSGGMQAYSQHQTGKFNNAMAEQNAKIQTQAAEDAAGRGAIEANAAKQNASLMAGSQRAAMAAGGVDVGSGSALDLLSDTARGGELDALIARNNAARESYGLQVSAADSLARGRMARQQGNMGAVSTILTTGANVYGMGQQGGMWGKK